MLTTVSRPVGMRPSNLVSIAVDTPALTTATMTLVRPIEAILITGGDVWTYTNNTHTHISISPNVRKDYIKDKIIHSHRECLTATLTQIGR